jgi:hypothetical protein
MSESVTTKCPCGAVVLTLTGTPSTAFYCHCRDCRLVHGAAYTLEAMYPARAVEIDGETKVFVLKTTPRVFCAQCGSRLTADLAAAGLRGVNGVLLPDFRAKMHINCESAVVPVRDGLPHYLRMPTSFGGDGALADW